MIIAVSTLFTLLNFVVVVLLAGYLLKTKGKPYLQSAMKAQEEIDAQSLQNYETIQQEIKQLQQQYEQSHLTHEQLEAKFLIWVDALSQEKRRADELDHLYQKAMNQRMQKINESMHTRLLVKQNMPDVLDEVTQDLYKQFENVAKQKEYVAKLISFLEK